MSTPRLWTKRAWQGHAVARHDVNDGIPLVGDVKRLRSCAVSNINESVWRGVVDYATAHNRKCHGFKVTAALGIIIGKLDRGIKQ